MDRVEVENRVNVTDDEVEALRSFLEDVTVEELEAMTEEEVAELRDSMPEDVRNLLLKFADAYRAARERAIFELMHGALAEHFPCKPPEEFDLEEMGGECCGVPFENVLAYNEASGKYELVSGKGVVQ